MDGDHSLTSSIDGLFEGAGLDQCRGCHIVLNTWKTGWSSISGRYRTHVTGHTMGADIRAGTLPLAQHWR